MDDHYHVSFSPLDLIIYSDICLIAGNKSKFAYHLCITYLDCGHDFPHSGRDALVAITLFCANVEFQTRLPKKTRFSKTSTLAIDM